MDIKPDNILVGKNNGNDSVKITHVDVNDFNRVLNCKGMFDTFESHHDCCWYFNDLFLGAVWSIVSGDKYSGYFREYVKKYTLTKDKIKKIISRTVRNVYRQNTNIETGEIKEINLEKIVNTCKTSFEQMLFYMEYMLGKVNKKKIELNGSEEKRQQLIAVLNENIITLDNVLKGNTIKECVCESIDKYTKAKDINLPSEYNRYACKDILIEMEPDLKNDSYWKCQCNY